MPQLLKIKIMSDRNRSMDSQNESPSGTLRCFFQTSIRSSIDIIISFMGHTFMLFGDTTPSEKKETNNQ